MIIIDNIGNIVPGSLEICCFIKSMATNPKSGRVPVLIRDIVKSFDVSIYELLKEIIRKMLSLTLEVTVGSKITK